MGSKYEPLARHLMTTEGDSLRISFKEIEVIIGELPLSARKHRAWWSNNSTNTSARNGWLAAGWRTSRVDMVAQELVFIRDSSLTLVSSRVAQTGEGIVTGQGHSCRRSSEQSLTDIVEASGGEENLIRVVQTIEEYIHGDIVETELGRRLRSLWPRNW